MNCILPFQKRECYDQSAPLPIRLSSLWFLEFKFKISFQVEPKIMGRTNNNPSLDQWIQIDYEALDILTNDIKKYHGSQVFVKNFRKFYSNDVSVRGFMIKLQVIDTVS